MHNPKQELRNAVYERSESKEMTRGWMMIVTKRRKVIQKVV